MRSAELGFSASLLHAGRVLTIFGVGCVLAVAAINMMFFQNKDDAADAGTASARVAGVVQAPARLRGTATSDLSWYDPGPVLLLLPSLSLLQIVVI